MTLADDIGASRPSRDANVVIGEDWDRPVDPEMGERVMPRQRRGLWGLRRSPLARKIVLFNLIALAIMLAIIYLNPFRDGMVDQRLGALRSEVTLMADVIEARMVASEGADDLALGLAHVTLPENSALTLRSLDGQIVDRLGQITDVGSSAANTPLVNAVEGAWLFLSQSVAGPGVDVMRVEDALDQATRQAAAGTLTADMTGDWFIASAPVQQSGQTVAVLTVQTGASDVVAAKRSEREHILRLFLVVIVVSVGLSLVLASTIANPISDLAHAAELGRDRGARKMSPARIRIPDLTARPDEIGRLSGALRGMVMALYDRIDANEQFAADVSHEIKNPLASLRSAVGTLRMTDRAEQRDRLLDVIEHDVRRLDRLVSDISNASRLDSELVKEDEETFDLLKTLGHLVEFHGAEAQAKGIDFITDLPEGPMLIQGLEGRLAQVFVNLITNAMSFCEPGDAVRVWVRQRENRVLVVVEDTGPGIPEEALTKVFRRFYSERPAQQFGDHSGLGLAISKQIVEAHGGVIWAENIRPTEMDLTADPLGARFVVGLPV